MRRSTIVCFCASLITTPLLAATYTCGVANGYPPFQFEKDGVPVGADVDLLQAVFQETGDKLIIKQTRWDDAVALLRFGKLDCLGGIEISEERKKIFDFTQPYYQRRIAVFTLAKNQSIKTLDDLLGQKIAGDRQSFVERYFESKGLLARMRVLHTNTKEESMAKLKSGEVVAIIAPRDVVLHLASQVGVKVRMLDNPDPGSPVGLAVRKGNQKMLDILDKGLKSLLTRKAVDLIYQKWTPLEPVRKP